MVAGESQVYKNVFNEKYSLMQKYRSEKNSRSGDQLFLHIKSESSEDILVNNLFYHFHIENSLFAHPGLDLGARATAMPS